MHTINYQTVQTVHFLIATNS